MGADSVDQHTNISYLDLPHTGATNITSNPCASTNAKNLWD